MNPAQRRSTSTPSAPGAAISGSRCGAAFTGQLNVNERLADALREEIRPAAGRVLAERQREAEAARATLAATRETARTRQPDGDRTRERDLAFEL